MFELWVPSLVLIGGAVLFVAGFLLRQRSAVWGWILMIFGPLAGLVVAPGMFQDKATVSKQEFTLHTGFWFAPTEFQVKFAEIARIDKTKSIRKSRRGTSTSYYLECQMKNGGIEKVPVGDLMKHGPADRILETARTHGIEILDEW